MLISCTQICMYEHTHAHSLDGTVLMWTQVVHVHTTHVSSADNRNNKHKQVVRPYKCMSQCRSNNNNTSGCASYKTRNGNGKITKQNKTNIFLHKRPCRCPQAAAGGSPPTWGTRHTTIPQLQGLCAGRDLEIKQRAQV